jgi:superfamily I DNA/RNA helicase
MANSVELSNEPKTILAESTEDKSNGRKLPNWKSPEEPSISVFGSPSNEEDPFGLDEIQKSREVLQLPVPELNWSKKETNKIQRQFLEEIEEKCVELHPSLVFYSKESLSRGDWACYEKSEAQNIIKTKSRLNKEQVEAALLCEDDLFIQALAGTGKTSLLSACISYLLALGVDPEKIGISSHTVTAAEEIKNRIFPTLEMLFPKTKESLGNMKPATGTIHAIAYRDMIFHKHPKARWTILDEPQQFRLWREATLFAFPERAQEMTSEEISGDEMRLFDRVRGYDIPESHVPKVLRLVSEGGDLAKIAEIYGKIKEARKLIDYTDLLREWAPIVMHTGYRNKWEYFFVDEFQDTNPLQKFLLKLLKLGGTKLIVCGDSRQSINSFTGSDPTSHNEFFREFNIKDTWLTTNYRCSKEILALANEVLRAMMPSEKGELTPAPNAHPGFRTKMVLTRREGDRRTFLPPKEAEIEKKKEAETTCLEAIRLYETLEMEEKSTEEDSKPSVAILYRTNAQGSLLEETISRINSQRQERGIAPLKYIRKDFRRTALRNKTEKEFLSVLSCWAAPQNTDWETLLLSPYFHGIGEVTARTIQRKSERRKPLNLEESATLFDKELSKRNAEAVGEFFLAWEDALKDSQASNSINENVELSIENACNAITKWIASSASKKEYEKGSKKESEEVQRRSYEAGIVERLKQKAQLGKNLSISIAEITDENEKASIAQNNANRALGLASSDTKIEKEDGLILSTIHLAKGREYDGVVIHQVSKGSLPHYNAIKFYENEQNMREKQFRKYSCFEELQNDDLCYGEKDTHLPNVYRMGLQVEQPLNEIDSWEDHNNPLEEEKRLLYVAITRAKKRLVITSKDHEYAYLPKKLWDRLKKGDKLA